LLQIFGLKNLVAVHAPEIIDSVASHQEFRALVFTERHRRTRIPSILVSAVVLSSPLFGGRGMA